MHVLTLETQLLDFPRVRQSTNYYCGPACLHVVMAYYGVNIPEKDIAKMLKTNWSEGTSVRNLIEISKFYAEEHRLNIACGSFTIGKIKQNIKRQFPVIVGFQAWGETENYAEDWKSGHYAVIIGYDEEGFFFEDPYIINRGYLSFEEFSKRWHICRREKIDNFALVLKGRPKFSSTNIEQIN